MLSEYCVAILLRKQSFRCYVSLRSISGGTYKMCKIKMAHSVQYDIDMRRILAKEKSSKYSLLPV